MQVQQRERQEVGYNNGSYSFDSMTKKIVIKYLFKSVSDTDRLAPANASSKCFLVISATSSPSMAASPSPPFNSSAAIAYQMQICLRREKWNLCCMLYFPEKSVLLSPARASLFRHAETQSVMRAMHQTELSEFVMLGYT